MKMYELGVRSLDDFWYVIPRTRAWVFARKLSRRTAWQNDRSRCHVD